jgi:Mg-chelatase subunit ChlD
MSDFDDLTDIEEQLDRIGIETELPIVHAIFVQDHSGSMSMTTGNGTRAQLAMNNFNEQLAKIQRESGEVQTNISIIEFDDRILMNGTPLVLLPDKHIVAIDSNDAVPMTDWWCGGSTALRDAIGAAINLGTDLIKNYDVKDQSVLVIILTDGEENDSREWSDEQIRKEIKHLEDSGIWTFTFMGGELQAQEAISKMGFLSTNTAAFANTAEGFKMSAEKTMSGLDKYYTARKVGETQVKDFFVDEEEKGAWQQSTKENI